MSAPASAHFFTCDTQWQACKDTVVIHMMTCPCTVPRTMSAPASAHFFTCKTQNIATGLYFTVDLIPAAPTSTDNASICFDPVHAAALHVLASTCGLRSYYILCGCCYILHAAYNMNLDHAASAAATTPQLHALRNHQASLAQALCTAWTKQLASHCLIPRMLLLCSLRVASAAAEPITSWNTTVASAAGPCPASYSSAPEPQ